MPPRSPSRSSPPDERHASQSVDRRSRPDTEIAEDGPQDRARAYAERPHGWGGFESNYDIASPGARRLDDSQAPEHVGKGPKGYSRSDERTRELICESLMHDPRIDARDVEVSVRAGELTFSGSVPDRWTKYAIEELSERYVSADRIRNELRIERGVNQSPWAESQWPIGS